MVNVPTPANVAKFQVFSKESATVVTYKRGQGASSLATVESKFQPKN